MKAKTKRRIGKAILFTLFGTLLTCFTALIIAGIVVGSPVIKVAFISILLLTALGITGTVLADARDPGEEP